MQFLRGVREEMGKVTWPERKELFSNTGTVLSTVIISAIFFFVVDSVLTWLLGLLV